MSYLPDHLRENLDVIFIGFNPSIKSGQVGHHYANPTNRFWKLLERSGLTPVQLKPEEDEKLLEFGFGLTNIVAKPTRAALDLTKKDYEKGREALKSKLKTFKPKIACYVGKGVYEHMTKTRPIPWGIQPKSAIPSIIDYVVPSSSGLVRLPFDEMVEIYRGLLSVVKNEDERV